MDTRNVVTRVSNGNSIRGSSSDFLGGASPGFSVLRDSVEPPGARDARVPHEEEAPGPLGRHRDPDPRATTDRPAPKVALAFQPHGAGGEVESVVGTGEAERARNAAGATS